MAVAVAAAVRKVRRVTISYTIVLASKQQIIHVRKPLV